ncbi:MAG TPA: RsmD family RNA methyltransferase, partial [Aeromicrobium sp.]|nr:RsmD family RNA methyltransferase [Aeromicrobium sp.]
FVDPPYAFPANELHEILATLGESAWSAPDSLIVVERAKRDHFEWPGGIKGVKEKKYGETTLWYGHCHD